MADQDGFLLDISGDALGITNVHTGPTYSAREATTRILENTLSYLKGTHNIQAGFAFTRAQVWLQNQQFVPTITFGINANDPAQAMFRPRWRRRRRTLRNAQLDDARELYATLTGRVTAISGELRLNEDTDEYQLPRPRHAACAARGLRVLPRRYLALEAELHAEPRSPLRAAAAVLPAEQQLLERDDRRRLRPLGRRDER